MGSGHISLARVVEGHHLIDLKQHPIFKVVEPVAILPILSYKLGRYSVLEVPMGYSFLPESPIIGLPLNDPAPFFAIGVMSLDSFRRQEKGNFFPGCVFEKPTLAAWEKITPGFWAVVIYNTRGKWENDHWSWQCPDGLVLSPETVNWEIWT